MLNAISKVFRALYSRYHLVRQYYGINSGLLNMVIFFSLPSRYSRSQSMCRFRVGGAEFYARKTDMVAVEEIVLRSEYSFVRHMVLQPNPIILDLGANIGMFSILAYNSFPQAEIHSFEPSSDTFQMLQMNKKSNPRANWRIYQKAVWKAEESVQFETAGGSTGRRLNSTGLPTTCEIVLATSLQKIIQECGRRISICKMDIEGAEEAVLEASIEYLGLIDSLIIEIHPNICNKERVIQILKSEFQYLYFISRDGSDKPLVVATHTSFDWALEDGVLMKAGQL